MGFTTEVGLCNVALGSIGQPGIASLVADPETATSKAQKWCSLLYPFVRDNLLETHPWLWATTPTTLTEDSAHPPAWGFSRAFTLPNDFIRLNELEDNDVSFSIENHPTYGKRLLCDLSVCKIKYVWAVTTVSLFPSFFANAVIRQLAAELLYPLTGGKDLLKVLLGAAKDALDDAKILDYGYQLSQPTQDSDSWLEARK